MLFFIFCAVSFSLAAQDDWQSYKNDTVSSMSVIHGWCSDKKALLMMDLIKEHQFKKCVDIGTFAGKSLFPIIKALQYNGDGHVFAIDAWNASESIKGLNEIDPYGKKNSNYEWWQTLDYDFFYQQIIILIYQHQLNKYCSVVRQSSVAAVTLFEDETIDFIHFDGNHNEDQVFQDVSIYFPKIKNGGYILLNDANWQSMNKALIFLLERTEQIFPLSLSIDYLLLRKDEQKIKNANKLMKP